MMFAPQTSRLALEHQESEVHVCRDVREHPFQLRSTTSRVVYIVRDLLRTAAVLPHLPSLQRTLGDVSRIVGGERPTGQLDDELGDELGALQGADDGVDGVLVGGEVVVGDHHAARPKLRVLLPWHVVVQLPLLLAVLRALPHLPPNTRFTSMSPPMSPRAGNRSVPRLASPNSDGRIPSAT